ncbi:hypothetical protein FA95DRAFT_1602084 [Auriscalpium vulgare]|uniref:Uncharacterized protein n=1 Tax=Auriscalpium vulgare TaxID=40419 RepID=A0ACB8S833_9AGAM|nr:hypothetical protein FA95DRAFT_1602084 [Auriscalpium vulgare]
MSRRPTFPRSSVLVLGSNFVQSLLPTTAISQAESLLESHRIADVVELLDQLRKKVQSKFVVDEDEVEELHYIYQRIGFQCFLETRFEDAGYNLFEGNLDPRVLISYFPDLRGALLSSSDELDMFSGIAEHMPPYDSVDDIIVANLVRNYSPHLSPNTRSAPPTAELRRVLGMAALEMLEVFLRKWRRVRGESGSPEVRVIVDTVLAKLFARAEKTTDLYGLVNDSNDLELSELEPVLQSTGQYNALCKLYQRRGDDEKLLEVWSKLVDGEWTDTDIPDPLSDIFNLLTERRNRQLTQKWGIWLTKKDSERAMKLLTTTGSSKRGQKTADDLAMLQQLRTENPEAAAQFLEYLVLQKRSTDRTLHTELALICVNEILSFLQDETVSKLWRAKASSYASAPSITPFLAYFEATTPDSPAKRGRLRTALFLQGSVLYDASAVREALAPQEQILCVELAIVEGKLGHHDQALSLLATTVRDHISAEAYCATRGCVLPPRSALTLAEKSGLTAWAGVAPPVKAGVSPSAADEEETKRLLHILLGVYMRGSDQTPRRPLASGAANGTVTAAANLLNSQALKFDPVDVLELVPAAWPLPTLSAFLTRSFRRALHAKHEGMLIKGVATAQNLAISEEAHEVLKEQGAIVEEALPPSPSSSSGELDEKVAYEHAAQSAPVDVVIPTGRGIDEGGGGMSYGSSVTAPSEEDGGDQLR